MDYRSRIIKKSDLEAYLAGKDNLKVTRIFSEVLSKLPAHLRKEAMEKGLELKKISKGLDLITFAIEAHNASDELRSGLIDLYPFVICDEQQE